MMPDLSSEPLSLLSVSAATSQPGKEDATSSPKPHDTEATDGPDAAAAPDAAPSTMKPAIQPDAAVGVQPQKMSAADGQPATPATVRQEADAVLPPESQAPPLERPPVAAAAEAEDKPLEPPPQRQQKPSNETAPPPQPEATETTDTRAGAATPKQTDSVSRAPLQELSDVAGQPQQTMKAAGQPDAPTTAEQVATLHPPPEPPSQENAAQASEAGKQLPAPPPPLQQEQVAGAAGEASSVRKEEDSAPVQEGADEKKPARRLWDCLRDAVHLQFCQSKNAAPTGDQTAPPPEDKGRDTKPSEPDGNKQPASLKEEKKPQRKDSAGSVPADPAKEKDEDEAQEAPLASPAGKPHPPGRRKSLRRAESQVGAVAGEPDVAASPPVNKFQKAIKRVLRIMSWYNRHRSSRKDVQAGPATEDDKNDKTKPTTAPEDEKGSKSKTELTSGQGKPPHPKWAEEEKRLEKILEESFTKLLATEYNKQLSSTKQKCLLTFSIFEPSSKVKKQSMIYWWVSQFNLPYRSSDPPKSGKNSAPGKTRAHAAGNDLRAPSDKATHNDKQLGAEGILSKLSDLGFLEPIKNYCCGVIHGCKVNPLVHWMVKRLAKDVVFADLDEDGRPTSSQTTSSILCLTASYREKLHQMRIAELAPEYTTQDKNKPTQIPSSKSPTKSAEKMETNDLAVMAKNKPDVMRSPSLPRQTKVEDQTEGRQNILPKGKQVILNIDAHVYPFSKSLFEHLFDSLTVLQLGQWWYYKNNTYMEVDGLESELLCAMNKLNNIRYLSLRGLSQLPKLPCWIQKLKSLEILDMRGCQNLVTIATKDISPLKSLTHLDLTECFMLEHIGRGISSLANLQVFKGFVFGSGTQGNTGCRIRDLKKLNKLQKLTISIATEANIRDMDLAQLKNLTKLQSLTITWSEIPAILVDDLGEVKDEPTKLDKFLDQWTSFELPKGLKKLDLRCYPKKVLKLKEHNNLEKLYLRGGDVEEVSFEKPNIIRTLRLRYLKKFAMEWKNIITTFNKIEHVEIMIKDENLLEYIKNNYKKDLKKDIKEEHRIIEKMREEEHKIIEKMREEESKIMNKMMIPKSILDENGVWRKDNKEEENRRCIFDQSTSKSNEGAKKKSEAQDASETSKGSSLGVRDVPSTKDTTTIQDAIKDIGKPRENENNNEYISNTQAGKDNHVPTQEVLDSKQNKITRQTSNLP